MSPAKSSRSSGAKLLEAAENEARRHAADSVEIPGVGAVITVYQALHYNVSFRPTGSGPRPEAIEDISDEDALRLIEAADHPARFANILEGIRNAPGVVRLRELRTAERRHHEVTEDERRAAAEAANAADLAWSRRSVPEAAS